MARLEPTNHGYQPLTSPEMVLQVVGTHKLFLKLLGVNKIYFDLQIPDPKKGWDQIAVFLKEIVSKFPQYIHTYPYKNYIYIDTNSPQMFQLEPSKILTFSGNPGWAQQAREIDVKKT